MLGSGGGWLDAFADRYPPDRARWLKRLYDRIGATVGNYVAGALLQATIAGVARVDRAVDPRRPLRAAARGRRRSCSTSSRSSARRSARSSSASSRCSATSRPTRSSGSICSIDLPAGREHGHPAAHPGARGRGAPVRRARLRAVREHAVRRARRAAGDPRRGRDPDHDPRVRHLPRHAGGGPARRAGRRRRPPVERRRPSSSSRRRRPTAGRSSPRCRRRARSPPRRRRS